MTYLKPLPWLATALALAGCVAPPPQGPAVMAMPTEGKNYQQFQQEDAYCRQAASNAIGGGSAAQAANDAAVGSAVVGTAVGAAAGALLGAAAGNAGAGAAIGAGTGLLVGGSAGAGNARYSAGAMQRQYDITYAQCMTSYGNTVQPYGAPRRYYPGYPPPAYGAPGYYPAYPPYPPPAYGY